MGLWLLGLLSGTRCSILIYVWGGACFRDNKTNVLSHSAGFSQTKLVFPTLCHCYFNRHLAQHCATHPKEDLDVCIPIVCHMLSPLTSGCKMEGPPDSCYRPCRQTVLTLNLKTEPGWYWEHGMWYFRYGFWSGQNMLLYSSSHRQIHLRRSSASTTACGSFPTRDATCLAELVRC